MCRSVEDCALVFDAIHGADGKDPTARDLPFAWDVELGVADLRIGYYERAFAAGPVESAATETAVAPGADLPSTRFFPEATLNVAENLLRRNERLVHRMAEAQLNLIQTGAALVGQLGKRPSKVVGGHFDATTTR